MSMPPARKEAVAASTDEVTSVETSSALKRFREDDLSMTSTSRGQPEGKKKKRLNDRDGMTKDLLHEAEQEFDSRDTVKDGKGTVKDDTEENIKEPDSSGGEFDGFKFGDFKFLEPEQGDVTERDRRDIREQLTLGSSVLVLERAVTWRSHCRARFCIPQILRGRPNIESDYRFNLMDLTGQRCSRTDWWLQPNLFFHISCIEHMFDLREVLEQGWLKMGGGRSPAGFLGNGIMVHRFPTIVEEWFENNGAVFTIDEYEAYKEACKTRDAACNVKWVEHGIKKGKDEHHEEQCSCDLEIPEVNKSEYFPEERTPRLLSQVLASLTEVRQIDGLSESLLADLKDMSAEEGEEHLTHLAEAIRNRRKQNTTSNSSGSKESGDDSNTRAEAAAAPPK